MRYERARSGPRQRGMIGTTHRGLAAYYGVGAGQIPIHLRPEDAVLDGAGMVIALPNAGGGGQYFGLTAASGPTRAGNALQFGADKRMLFANNPNLAGSHLIAAINPGVAGTVTNRVLAPGAGSQGVYYTERSATVLDWRYSSPTSTQTVRLTTNLAAWHIAELRFSAGQVWLLWDGQVVLTAAAADASFLVSGIGTSGVGSFLGRIGGLVSVVCAPGQTGTSVEPAVLLARENLAAQWGISL